MRILNNKFRKSLIRRKFKVITKNQGFVNGEYFVLDMVTFIFHRSPARQTSWRSYFYRKLTKSQNKHSSSPFKKTC